MLASSLFTVNMPSTVIASMHYNADTATLRIRFVSGLVYDYLEVPGKIYRAMQKASSKGTFLNQFIKGKYDFKKIG